ncbi:MAG: acyltransferase 3 [Gemmatimonadetes bacterium]|nr:acyltransferase 3 [Gemmatimonadota bacterium]
MASPRLRFRPDIEGLRAVAIVFVVLYHAGWKWAGGGYLGVDVFFVLSGFLITGILLEEVEATGSLSLTNFWARRARRLLPAAAVITFVVLIVDAILLTPFDQIAAAESARAFAVYASNILFAFRTTQYFGGPVDPMLHTWSLSVEEQFYLFFAPLLLALAVWSRRHVHGVFAKRLGIATVFVSVASFVGCLILVQRYPLVAFFILPPRAWEFGLGALTVLAVRRVDILGPGVVEGLSIAAIAGLLASAAFFKSNVVQPLGFITLVPTACAAALILTGASARESFVGRMLSTSPMRLIGRLSYSWYLWHWPMLVFLREYVSRPSLPLSVAVAIGSLIPAAITYKLIESPVRFSKALQKQAKLVLVGALVLAVVTIGLATLAVRHANNVLAAPKFAALLAARVLPDGYGNGCHLSIATVKGPDCVYGKPSGDTTMVLFGDSHSEHFMPALDSIAKLRGWKLVSLTKSACPSVDVHTWNGQLGRQYSECDEWRQASVERIVKLKPALVMIANTRAYEVVIGDERLRTDQREEARREWTAGLTRLFTALRPSGARLMVMQNNPHPSFDISKCIVKHMDNPVGCSSYRMRAVDTVLAPAVRAAIKGMPGASYVSLNSLICEGSVCPVVKDGLVRYQDGNHLSKPYVLSILPQLSDLLTQALAQPRPQ